MSELDRAGASLNAISLSTGAAQLVAQKLGRRPQAPEGWWQRRFGWPPATADSEQGDEEVINRMVKVTQLAGSADTIPAKTVTNSTF